MKQIILDMLPKKDDGFEFIVVGVNNTTVTVKTNAEIAEDMPTIQIAKTEWMKGWSIGDVALVSFDVDGNPSAEIKTSVRKDPKLKTKARTPTHDVVCKV